MYLFEEWHIQPGTKHSLLASPEMTLEKIETTLHRDSEGTICITILYLSCCTSQVVTPLYKQALNRD